MITLYGIPNCDTVKRSRAWFAEHAMACTFHDFKSKGVPAAELDRWIEKLGWEALLEWVSEELLRRSESVRRKAHVRGGQTSSVDSPSRKLTR